MEMQNANTLFSLYDEREWGGVVLLKNDIITIQTKNSCILIVNA
jgi:hypothetical protein